MRSTGVPHRRHKIVTSCLPSRRILNQNMIQLLILSTKRSTLILQYSKTTFLLLNSADFGDEDSFNELNLEESNLNVELEPFILPSNEENTFTDDPNTSFVNEIIESSSGKLNEKLNEILNQSDKYSSQCFSPNPEKTFAIENGNPSSEETTSSSTLMTLHVSFKSSPFYYSKHCALLLPSHQEGIASTKGEIRLDLINSPFYLDGKPSRAFLPFKKRFDYCKTGSVSASFPIRTFKEDSELRDI